MGALFTRSLAEILRSTLLKLEETSDLRQDDNAVIELKKHIVRAIAELEIAKASHTARLTLDGVQSSRSIDPPAPAEPGPNVTVGIEVVPMETVAPAPASSPEPLVAEPAAEISEMPLLAENGTATSN